MRRALACGLLAVACAFGQLELSTMPDRTVRAPGDTIALGTAAIGDRAMFAFRVTNTGVAPVNIDKLDVAGVGFGVADSPVLPGAPATLLSRAWLEFHVMLEPAMAGGYSGTLIVNNAKYLLVARAVLGVSVSLEAGDPLLSDSVIDFGKVRRGESTSRHFVLANRNPQAIRVEQIEVAGDGFRGPAGVAAPITIDAKQNAAFEVFFEPQSAGAHQGTLTVDSRTIRLAGAGLDPPAPPFQIAVQPAAVRSGQQAKVVLKFGAKSPVRAEGLLQMDFIGKGDPSVTFVAPAGRSAKFEIREGEDTARFGDEGAIDFQTGTTAGTITFTATLGDETEQASIQIAPEAIGVDTLRVTRGNLSIAVALTGFDNTRSASTALYTFYDKTGKAIGGGAIRADVKAAFESYFLNPEMGGAFVLRALFPVTGGTDGIDALDVDVTNSAGTSRGHVKIAE